MQAEVVADAGTTAADDLAAITGLETAQCHAYLAAFGSLEAASNAFFDGRVPAALGGLPGFSCLGRLFR